MSVFDIRTDALRNRLFFTVDGLVSPSDARRVAAAVVREAALLEPGFRVIQDTSTAQGTNTLESLLSELRERGMGQLMQVVQCAPRTDSADADLEEILLERLLGT